MFQALWEAQRPFILRVAAGAAVFLILMNLVVGYRVEGREATDRAVQDHGQVARDLEARAGRHRQHQRAAGVWEERVDGLRSTLAIGDQLRIEPPPELDSTMIDFPRRFGEIYAEFTDRAKRSTVGYPEQNDIDFRESKNLDAGQWRDRYVQLEIVRRVFDAGIDARIDRLVSVSPEAVVVEPIASDPELAHYRYPVTVEFVAGYAEALTFLTSFQGEDRFLSVEVKEVSAESPSGGDDGQSKLRVRVSAVGIDLGPPREEKPSGRRGRGFGS